MRHFCIQIAASLQKIDIFLLLLLALNRLKQNCPVRLCIERTPWSLNWHLIKKISNSLNSTETLTLNLTLISFITKPTLPGLACNLLHITNHSIGQIYSPWSLIGLVEAGAPGAELYTVFPCQSLFVFFFFNSLGVAGAVLQSPPSLR